MDLGKKLIALELIITQFALGQMQANDIPPDIALLVMQGVCGRFQNDAIAHMIESQITYNNGEPNEEVQDEQHIEHKL